MSCSSVPCRANESFGSSEPFGSSESSNVPTTGLTVGPGGVHLTKGERRMMHSLLDREEGETRLVASKHAEEVIDKLISLGFIEVKVTEAGRAFMDAT